ALSALCLPPVGAGGREDRPAAGRLGGAVEHVGDPAPDRVVRRVAMRLQRRLVLVHLVEVVDVLVLLVLQHVEAQAARLVPLRSPSGLCPASPAGSSPPPTPRPSPPPSVLSEPPRASLPRECPVRRLAFPVPAVVACAAEEPPMDPASVSALTFDVFGTVVD